MATEVKIPTPDQTTEKVRIVKWQKAVGDPVAKGDVILEMETDKAVLEVEASASGVLLTQFCAEEDIVSVGTVVGLIGAEGEKVAGPSTRQAPSTDAVETAAAPSAVDKHANVSPVAKKLADTLGVDPAKVKGTGQKGKVTRRDVEEFAGVSSTEQAPARPPRISPNAKRLAAELGVDLSTVTGTGPAGRITGKDIRAAAEKKQQAAPTQPKPGTVVPLSRMRKAIGVRLQGSSHDRPHFNVTISIDMTRALDMRTRFNESRPKDRRLSVTHIVVMACANALKKYPAVNSRFENDTINYLADINIGIATALDAGLVVPVLVNADRLGWDELITQGAKLVQEARNGKIIAIGKGTFTISNLGMLGVDYFTAIINPPESAILAVGAVKNQVVDIGGDIGIRPIMKVTLCSDHRVIDGVVAAQFLNCLKEYLEQELA